MYLTALRPLFANLVWIPVEAALQGGHIHVGPHVDIGRVGAHVLLHGSKDGAMEVLSARDKGGIGFEFQVTGSGFSHALEQVLHFARAVLKGLDPCAAFA